MRPPARRKPATPPQPRRCRRDARGVAGAAVPQRLPPPPRRGLQPRRLARPHRSRTPEPGHRATGRAATGAVRRATASGQPDSIFPAWIPAFSSHFWVMILLAQLKFRKGLSASERAGLKYKMWLFPVSSYLALRSWCWWSA